jgi:peptidoglycan/LPS O-acetylase OafA/YrhL
MTVTREVSGAAPARTSAQRYRAQLTGIDALRFLAALHIVFSHSFWTNRAPAWVLNIMRAGPTSTGFFFILSGFILTYAYSDAHSNLRVSKRRFWLARVSRLYPLTWLGHLAVVPLVWYRYGTDRWPRAALCALGLEAYVPHWADSFDTPAWSVGVLFTAYALLPWVLPVFRQLDKRRALWLMPTLWIVGLLPTIVYYATLPHSHDAYAALHTFPLVRIPEFLLGIASARILITFPTPSRMASAWIAYGSAAVLFAALIWSDRISPILLHNGLLDPVHAILVYGVAIRSAQLSGPTARILKTAGASTFSLFLLHLPLFAWMTVWRPMLLPDAGSTARALYYALFLVLALILSVACTYLFVEPISRAIRGAWTKSVNQAG